MPAVRRFSRIDTFDLKLRIEKRLGSQKAQNYFNLLTRYLSLNLRKSEFNKLCVGLIGRENVRLHNDLIIAIVKNGTVSKVPPQKHVRSDHGTYPVTDLQSLCAFPKSPKKGRTPNLRERKFKDRTVPSSQHLGTRKAQHQQRSATELRSLGSKPPLDVNSVEDGEEVEQYAIRISPSVHCRSPVSAPLGIDIHPKEKRKVHGKGLGSAYPTETCHYSGHLPATNALKNRLTQNLQMEGLDVSLDCANLLNNGLDCFLTSVLKPSLELARLRSFQQSGPGRPFFTSMLDIRMTTETNPKIFGAVSRVVHEHC